MSIYGKNISLEKYSRDDDFKFLSDAMREYGLLDKGRLICRSAAPKFVSKIDYVQIVKQSRTALTLIDIAEAAVRSSAERRDRLFGQHPLRSVIERHLDYDMEPIGRFDALIDADRTVKFIEYNPGLCGGPFFSETLAEIFKGFPPIQAILKARDAHFIPLIDHFWDAFHRAYAAATQQPMSRLGLIVPDGPLGDQWAAHPELRMILAGHQRSGGETRVIRIGDLRCHDGAMFAEDWKVDAAIIVDWAPILLSVPLTHPLWQPSELTRTWIFNSLGTAVFRGGKHLFAVISDPTFLPDLGKEARAWIDRHIPWTRIVCDGKTTADGTAIDLLSFIRDNRERLVLKPAFAMAGQGVALGWECDDKEWAAAIEASLATPSVVQERVLSIIETYPCMTEEGMRDLPLYSDLCTFVWYGGEVSGLYSRMAQGALLNVGAGNGFIVPVFVCDR